MTAGRSEVLLIGGRSGVGKSTAAAALHDLLADAHRLDADEYAATEAEAHLLALPASPDRSTARGAPSD